MNEPRAATPWDFRAKLTHEIESLARPLYARSGGAPSVTLSRNVDRGGGAVYCAAVGVDPSYSLLVGFGRSEESALLALLREVRQARTTVAAPEAPGRMAHALDALAAHFAQWRAAPAAVPAPALARARRPRRRRA